VAVHHSSAAVRLCVFLRLAAVPDVHQMPWKAGCQPLSGPRQIRRPWMFHGGEKRGRRKLEAHADQLMEVKWASASSSPPSIGLCGWNWWSWYWHHLHAAFPSSANQGGTRQARHGCPRSRPPASAGGQQSWRLTGLTHLAVRKVMCFVAPWSNEGSPLLLLSS